MKKFFIITWMQIFFINSIFALTKPDVKTLSIEQINKLPIETINSLPFLDIIPKYIKIIFENRADRNKYDPTKIAIVQIENDLNELKFYMSLPTGTANKNLENSVKRFQLSINKKPDGILKMEEYKVLQDRAAAILRKNIEVYPLTSKKAQIFEDFNYVSAEGTWYLINEKIADPINSVKITCERATKVCLEFSSSLVEMKQDASPILYLDTKTYSIVEWGQKIIALDQGPCRITKMIIDTNIKEVGAITNDVDSEKCKDVPKIGTKGRISRLGGNSIVQDYNRENTKRIVGYLNTDYINALRKFMPEDMINLILSS